MPSSDANSILLVTLNRHQDDMRIYSANPRSSVCQMIVENKSSKYVKEEAYTDMKVTDNYILVPCDKGENITLNVYSITGTLKREISLPNKDITATYGIDQKTGDVYFQAASPTPKDRQVFVSKANGKLECLTPEAGTAAAQFSETFKYFLKTWSDADTPYKFSVCNGQGKDIKVNTRRNTVHYHTLWQRTRIKRFCNTDIQTADKERWSTYGNASRHHPLLHAHS